MRNNAVTINMKSAFLLFLLASFSPSVRLSEVLAAKYGDRAGWISIFLSCAVYCGLIVLISHLLKGREKCGLYELYRMTLGGIAGNTISVVYLVWVFVLIGLYVRAFAERFASSILPSSPTELFVITSLLFCYLFLSFPFGNFVRMTTVFFYIVLISLIAIFFSQLENIRLANFFPVTTLDTVSVLKASLPYLNILSYVTYLLFFFDEVDNKEQFKSLGFKSAFVLLCSNQIIFFVTVGVFGSKLTQNLSLPFFMSVKTISLFGAIERLESLLILLWVITDLAMIMMLMYVFLRLVGKIFKMQNALILKNPLILGIFLFSMRFVGNFFELTNFSEKITLYVNLFLGMLLPAFIFILFKIRNREKKLEA